MHDPEHLPKDIAAAIDRLSEKPAVRKRIRRRSVSPSMPPQRKSRFRAQHVATFCTGLVVGVVSLAVLWQQQLIGPLQPGLGSGQPSHFYGTLAPASSPVPGPASDNMAINGHGVSGTARAVYADQKVLVRMSLQTSRKIDVVLLYGDQLWCQGYRTSINAKQSLSTSYNRACLTVASDGDLEFILHDNQSLRPPVMLVLRSGGQTLYEGTLEFRL